MKTTFAIIATRLDNNGQRVDASDPATLGDSYAEEYTAESEALAVAAELAETAASYDMADAVYTVVKIEIDAE